jgi:Asp-tRNA(Asn)/Glu-tRNA(Gln) amidotransferase A subunit family amidase
MPTTGGSLSLAGYTPVTDAAITRKLRSAGAIILAKERVDNLGAFRIPPETGLLIPSGYSNYPWAVT